MSRIKALMLGVLAVFAIGAIASASASASVWEECLEKEIVGTKYTDNHCATESGTGTFGWMPISKELKITSKGATQLLELQTNPAIIITCKKVIDAGALKAGGEDEVNKLEYKECSINIAGCAVVKGSTGDTNGTISVKSLIKTKLLTLEISGKLLVEDEFKPKNEAEEEVFVELEIGKKENAKKEAEGACGVLPVKVKVKGNTVAMVEGQNLSFEGTGTLTAAGIAAKYLGLVENVLEDGKLFRASN